MRLRLPLLVLCLTLAACEGEQPETRGRDGAAPAGAASPAAPAAAPDSPVANTIPARFHGVWDSEDSSCEVATELRIAIAPATIGFFESEGTVTRVRQAQSGAILVDLAMEGEGENWETSINLALSGSGAAETLVSQPAPSRDIPLSPVRLKRC